MANTIRLKRGSGSDPGTSDLVVGEVAVRTDNGKLFTKKDDGTIAEISGSGGGGGISDGDKGDITVSNSGDTFTIDNGVVTSAKIADGTIVNADISSLANIDGSKIQAAGLINAGVMTAAQNNKLAGIEDNATADMTSTEILAVISGENIILGAVSSTGNSSFAGNLTVSSSDGGSSAAPEIDIYRNSASPADADYLGQIKFTGESDDGSKEVYAKITAKIGDASSGTEDGILEIAHTKAGSNNISARFTSTDLKLINGTGLEVAGDTALSGDLEISSTVPTINFVDTNNNSDFSVKNENGVFKIVDTTNSTTRFQIISSGITNIEAPLNVDGNFITSGTGTVNGGNLTISGTAPFLKLNDTDNNPDYKLFNIGGVFQIFDDTNSAVRLKVTTGGNIQIPADDKKFQIGASNDLELFHDSNDSIINDAGTGNLKLQLGGSTKLEITSAGATLTGALSLSSTVDGRDIASDGSKLDGIESGATADQTNSEIKTAYEANSNTNAFTDALLSKLNGIAASATNVTNNNQLTNGAGFITATLTNEQVQDIVGGMVSGNTESGITVTYQDGDGTLDFVVGTLNQNTTGSAATLTTARTIAGTSFDGSANIDISYANLTNKLSVGDGGLTQNNFTNTLKSKLDGIASGATNVTNTNQLTNGAGFITATLTNEQVQDIVGGMVTGNTETGITVTYQDGDGTLDFVVGTLNQDTTGNAATATALETARTIAGVSFDGSANISLNNNAITNGAGYITGFSGVAGGGTFTGAITAPTISGSNGIVEMKQEIGTSHTLTTGYNAIAIDPTIANGVTITVPTGAIWSIV